MVGLPAFAAAAVVVVVVPGETDDEESTNFSDSGHVEIILSARTTEDELLVVSLPPLMVVVATEELDVESTAALSNISRNTRSEPTVAKALRVIVTLSNRLTTTSKVAPEENSLGTAAPSATPTLITADFTPAVTSLAFVCKSHTNDKFCCVGVLGEKMVSEGLATRPISDNGIPVEVTSLSNCTEASTWSPTLSGI